MKPFLKLASMLLLVLLSFSASAAVNINTADAVSLQSELKGIGLKKAEAIVAYREAHGNFQSVEDLANVKGIGMKTIEQNRDNIILELPKDSM